MNHQPTLTNHHFYKTTRGNFVASNLNTRKTGIYIGQQLIETVAAVLNVPHRGIYKATKGKGGGTFARNLENAGIR